MKNQMPTICPSCGSELHVTRLVCNSCNTEIEGNYRLPVLLRLSQEDQDFILRFVRNSGSLKKMAKELQMSYPTVRNKLNNLIDRIQQLEQTHNQE